MEINPMTRTLALFGVCLAIGCDAPSSDATTTDQTTPAGDQNAADNTKVNERDRDAATLTPEDQGNNESDLGITQRIRQTIVATDSLTMTEKNVKVITVDGVVTLRGPVESEQSKVALASIAKDATGVKRVDDQLEVTGTASASAEPPDETTTTK
jgi:hyperosmotically inducible periplasmic protein